MNFSWRRALIVARREFLTTVKRKAFLFTLIAVPLYFGGVMTLASRGAMSGRRDTMRSFTRLGVVDSSGLLANAAREITTRLATDPTNAPDKLETYHTDVVFYPDQAGLEQALRAGRIVQGLTVSADYLATGVTRRYIRSTGSALNSSSSVRPIERWLARSLLAGHADSLRIERATRPAGDMDLYSLGKDDRFEIKDERREMLEFMVPFMVSILLGVCIMTGGQYLLQGVSEEKESRILESLLCALSPEELLAGKLVGLGGVGFALVAVWIGVGAALSAPMLAMAQLPLSPGLLALAVMYFLLGYLFFASIMTGIGAVTNNMREAQQFSMMFSFANLMPIIVLTQILSKPDGALAVALSLFPFTAATAMMLRLGTPSSAVPAWQIALSLALLALSGWLVLRGAARVFRIGLLMTGKTPNLPEIWRWARAGK
jgi:ABC-2 type transport system permease protein